MQLLRFFSSFVFILSAVHSVLGQARLVPTKTSLNRDQLAAANAAYDTYGASVNNITPGVQIHWTSIGLTAQMAQERYDEINAFNDSFREIQMSGGTDSAKPRRVSVPSFEMMAILTALFSKNGKRGPAKASGKKAPKGAKKAPQKMVKKPARKAAKKVQGRKRR
ncbi:hypothetical protein NMY22_g9968 [Coprinellus aureogranulatus]|nr:hypothetical protein NMY22_g9968 [Coprinellus aureogranulatus]